MNSWGFSLVLTLLEVISVRDTLVMKFSRRLENFFPFHIGQVVLSFDEECQEIKIQFCLSEKKHTGIIGFQSRLTEEYNPFLIWPIKKNKQRS